MNLQLLDFDSSEDAEGVVCWDALAEPASDYNPALLHEVEKVLAWAHDFDDKGPGSLENGANWDYDLQVLILGKDLKPQRAITLFETETRQLTVQPKPTSPQSLSLSLTLSGSPAFVQAFRAEFDLE